MVAPALWRLCGAIGIARRRLRHCQASGDNEAYVKSIGASRVINYREAQFESVLREKVDMVFDLIVAIRRNGRSSS